MWKVISSKGRPVTNMENRIYKEWQNLSVLIDSYGQKAVDLFFMLIKSEICDMLHKQSQELADVYVPCYDRYRTLLEIYAQMLAVEPSLRTGIISPEISDLLSEITSTLFVRVRMFNEGKGNFAAFPLNPVAIEREELTAKALKTFRQGFDSAYTRFAVLHYMDIINESRSGLFPVCDEESLTQANFRLLGLIEEHCFAQFYECYEGAAKQIELSLRDIPKRKVAGYYTNLMNRETEIFYEYLSPRFENLESRLEKTFTFASQKEALAQLISCFHKAKEIMANETNPADFSEFPLEMFAHFSHRIKLFLAESMKLGRIHLLGRHLLSQFDQAMEGFSSSVSSAFNSLVDKHLGQGLVKRMVLDMNRIVYSSENLAKEIQSAFVGLSSYYNEHSESLTSCEMTDIIAGIRETIEIKTESLQEYLDNYSLEAERILHEFENDNKPRCCGASEMDTGLLPGLFFKEIVDVVSVVRDEKKIIPTLKRVISEFPSTEAFKALAEQQLREKNAFFEKLQKISMGFKKDSVLFEVATFEEISNYSVCRLRESTDPAVIDYVAALDSGAKTIEQTLLHFDIVSIRPNPHDPFNAKEHEVIMAEKQEGFKKGEIIKLMNSGFKQNDNIILRANVIAAR